MKRSLLALALLATLPLAANAADGLSYSYIEGGYVNSEIANADADGWGLNGSFAIAENFFLFGGYSQQEFDDFDVDLDTWNIGAGYHFGLNSMTDLVTRVGYENNDLEFAGSDFEDWFVDVGVRAAFTPNFEGYALAGYQDGDAYDGEFYGKLGAQVKFNPTWGITGDVKFIDDDTQYFIGPRISF